MPQYVPSKQKNSKDWIQRRTELQTQLILWYMQISTIMKGHKLCWPFVCLQQDVVADHLTQSPMPKVVSTFGHFSISTHGTVNWLSMDETAFCNDVQQDEHHRLTTVNNTRTYNCGGQPITCPPITKYNYMYILTSLSMWIVPIAKNTQILYRLYLPTWSLLKPSWRNVNFSLLYPLTGRQEVA